MITKHNSNQARMVFLLLALTVFFSSVLGYKLLNKFYSAPALSDAMYAKSYPCVVIGGGVGGLTSAIYLSQLGCKTLVIEGDHPGGALTKSAMVQNWPGEEGINGATLVGNIRQHAQKCGATMQSGSVIDVNFAKWPFEITYQHNGQIRTINTLTCIVATGATPKLLNVPGEQEFWGRGVTNCAICDGPMFKDGTVAIVGGGDAAVNEALILEPLVKKIYMLLRSGQMRSKDAKAKRILQSPKIEIMLNCKVAKILGDKNGVAGVLLDKGDTNNRQTLALSGVFLAIGSTANTAMLKNSLELDKNGLIKLHNVQETSKHGVYAIGDVCDGKFRQAVSAAGDGCRAALQVMDFLASKQVELNKFSTSEIKTIEGQEIQAPQPKPKKTVAAKEKPPKVDVAQADADTDATPTPDAVIELDNEAESDGDAQDVTAPSVTLEPEDQQAFAHKTVTEIKSMQELEKLFKKNKPLVLDCYATWCPPCKLMLPIFDELAAEFPNMIFVKANADACPEVLKKFGVRGVPTFILFNADGSSNQRFVGARDKEEFKQMLQDLAKASR